MSPANASADEPIHDRLAVFDAKRVSGRRDLAAATGTASGWTGTAPRLEREGWWAPRVAAWVHAYPCAHAQGYDAARRSTAVDGSSLPDPRHQDQGSIGPRIRGQGPADELIEVAVHGSTEVPGRADD